MSASHILRLEESLGSSGYLDDTLSVSQRDLRHALREHRLMEDTLRRIARSQDRVGEIMREPSVARLVRPPSRGALAVTRMDHPGRPLKPCPSCQGDIPDDPEANFCGLCRHPLRPDAQERAAERGATRFLGN